MSQVGWTHFPDNQYIYIYICLNIIRNPPTPEIPNSIYVWALIQKLLLPPPPPFARILLWFAPKTYLSLSLSNSVTYTYISSACYVLWRYPDSASNNHPLPPPTHFLVYLHWLAYRSFVGRIGGSEHTLSNFGKQHSHNRTKAPRSTHEHPRTRIRLPELYTICHLVCAIQDDSQSEGLLRLLCVRDGPSHTLGNRRSPLIKWITTNPHTHTQRSISYE